MSNLQTSENSQELPEKTTISKPTTHYTFPKTPQNKQNDQQYQTVNLEIQTWAKAFAYKYEYGVEMAIQDQPFRNR